MNPSNRASETALSELLEGIAAIPTVLKLLKNQQQQIAAIQKEMSSRADGIKMDSDGWLDAKCAARYLGISENTFDKYRYKTTPKIKGYPLDGKILYKKSDLDAFVRLYELKSTGRG